MSTVEKRNAFERLRELQKGIQSLSASVVQEKQSPLLKDKVRIEGKIIVKRPNLLRWETVKPEKELTVADGKTMIVYHPGTREAQVHDLLQDIAARGAMNLVSGALLGSLGEMEKRFSVSMSKNDAELSLKLVPLSKITGKYISSLVLQYDEDAGLPRGFEMTTPKGDITVARFTNVKTNIEIQPDTFRLALPPDTCITNRYENGSR